MLRPILLALSLAACAATPPAPELPPLGVALSCNADDQREIDQEGARTIDGEVTIPVALVLPAGNGPAELCMATGCEPTVVTRVPLSRTPDWAARLQTGGDDRGVVTLSADRSQFELTQPRGDGGVRIWTGQCAPAGS